MFLGYPFKIPPKFINLPSFNAPVTPHATNVVKGNWIDVGSTPARCSKFLVYSSMVEHPAVNGTVAGSSPARSANFDVLCQGVGESGRPYHFWKVGIVSSNLTTLTKYIKCICNSVD
jgi:hypothetical protein